MIESISLNILAVSALIESILSFTLDVNEYKEAVALFKDADAMFKAVLTFIEPVKLSIEANLLLADCV
jgi:hypothetical protein